MCKIILSLSFLLIVGCSQKKHKDVIIHGDNLIPDSTIWFSVPDSVITKSGVINISSNFIHDTVYIDTCCGNWKVGNIGDPCDGMHPLAILRVGTGQADTGSITIVGSHTSGGITSINDSDTTSWIVVPKTTIAQPKPKLHIGYW